MNLIFYLLLWVSTDQKPEASPIEWEVTTSTLQFFSAVQAIENQYTYLCDSEISAFTVVYYHIEYMAFGIQSYICDNQRNKT